MIVVAVVAGAALADPAEEVRGRCDHAQFFNQFMRGAPAVGGSTGAAPSDVAEGGEANVIMFSSSISSCETLQRRFRAAVIMFGACIGSSDAAEEARGRYDHVQFVQQFM